MKPQFITISQCENAKSSSVWALNNTGGTGRVKGVINITITEGNGRAAAIKIHDTKIPVDMTTQATKSALLMSPDFRRLVSSRVITLISEEDAMAMLDSDEARAEQRRILDYDSSPVNGIQPDAPVAAKTIMDQASGEIGGFAMNLAHTTEGDEEAIVASLRNNSESLTKLELQYIVNNSTFAKVKGLAAELAVA